MWSGAEQGLRSSKVWTQRAELNLSESELGLRKAKFGLSEEAEETVKASRLP